MLIRFLNYLNEKALLLRYGNRIILHETASFDYKTRIRPVKGLIHLGRGVCLKSINIGYHAGMPFGTTLFTDVENAKILIGDNSRINGAYIHAQKNITIGPNTVIASGVHIIDSNGHLVNSKNRTVGRDSPESITIGRNVWIGLNSIILKGSEIGDNCVVGACSIVNGKFSSNTLIIGNPAREVKVIDI